MAAQPTPATPDRAPLERVIPPSLLERPQWVTWRKELRRRANGEDYWTKVPCNPRNGHKAQSTNPKTWGAFREAVAAAKRYHHDGIGFVVMKADGIVGIDLDHCRDPQTGQIEAWALAIVRQMQSYTEISPSGTGLRIMVFGTLPPQHRKDGDIEMYDAGRFFTITGRRLSETPGDLTTHPEALDALYRAVFAARLASDGDDRRSQPATSPANPTRLDDAAIVKSAHAAKNGAKFTRLWAGDMSDYRGDASRADMALCGMLAFWTGPDAARIDRIFRQSGLMRGKWDEQRGESTYGARTIMAVLSTARDFYSDPKVTPLRKERPVTRPQPQPRTDGANALATYPRAVPQDEPDDDENDAGDGNDGGNTPPPPGISPDGSAHWTDLGNARRLVERHGANMRFVAAWNQWLVWDDKRWRRDTTAEAVRLAKDTVASIYLEVLNSEDGDERKEIVKWAAKSEAEARIRSMLALTQSEPEIALESDSFDRAPLLLTVANGTLDLRTGQLLPHDRKHLVTRLAPVAYDPAAQCPTWRAFLRRIMDGDDELIGFLQRAVGYSLTDDTSEQVLFLLHGNGANGKSKFLEAIEGIVGDYGMQTPTTTLMAKRDNNIPNDVARLKGARFVKAIETDEGHALAESLVKQMTGGDMLSARFMRGEWFDFKPTFKLWLAANHLPTIRGNDDGIWRRIRYIPFEVQIPEAERDNHLGEKLQAEYPGILAWAVEGCLQWQREGLRPPEKVTRATSAYRSAMDRFSAFLDDCCVLHHNATVSAKRFRHAYEQWCGENGEHPKSASWIGQQLQRRGVESRRADKGGSTVYYGVGLVEIPVQADFTE